MLSRTTTISGGGGCKAFVNEVRWAPATRARERARGQAHRRAEECATGMRHKCDDCAMIHATMCEVLMRLSVGAHLLYAMERLYASRLMNRDMWACVDNFWGRPWGCTPLQTHAELCINKESLELI